MNQKSILITGATSGIGLQTAKYLSHKGYNLILTGRKVEVLKDIDWPTQVQIIKADLSSSEHINELCHQIEQGPHKTRLFSIVNNAGIFIRKDFLNTSLEEWNKLFQVNLISTVQIMQKLIPLMIKSPINGQSIVNIASTAGHRPVMMTSCYSATKAAMIALTQNLALEFAHNGIRFNCICPGVVDTPIHDINNTENPGELRKAYNELHPLGRMGTPIDVAYAIEYFIDEKNSWITGDKLILDGGLSLKG